MKSILGRSTSIFALVFLLISTSINLYGQTTISILPVNIGLVDSSPVLSPKQWQHISEQIQDHFVIQLSDKGTITKLSREHILLLLKEMPDPDLENLNIEAYRVISKKESFQYLLRCSVESIQVIDRNVIFPIRVIIIDGSNGKVFWEKTLKVNEILSSNTVTGQLLLNEVFKPSVRELSEQIRKLNF